MKQTHVIAAYSFIFGGIVLAVVLLVATLAWVG